MTTTLEAIYENGIFKPVSRVPENIREHERVKIIIETAIDNDKVSPELYRQMLAEGMISRIPEGGADEEDDFEPVEIEGRPLSETVLEDRE